MVYVVSTAGKNTRIFGTYRINDYYVLQYLIYWNAISITLYIEFK